AQRAAARYVLPPVTPACGGGGQRGPGWQSAGSRRWSGGALQAFFVDRGNGAGYRAPGGHDRRAPFHCVREGESMARPLAGLLVVLFVSPLAAAPPARDGTAPRTDRNGDPLPKGAVARLGIPYLYNPGAEIMAFLPDGKTLAVAAGGTLRLWDVGSSRERRHFTTHPQHGVFPTPITCLAVSPDGKLLAVGCED